MERVLMFKIYSTKSCGYCSMAKQVMKNLDIEYEDIDLNESADALAHFRTNNFKTVPQIYDSEGNHIGGYMELREHLK